jgi:hypothetical protein
MSANLGTLIDDCIARWDAHAKWLNTPGMRGAPGISRPPKGAVLFTHGRQGYRRGCRCEECRAVMRSAVHKSLAARGGLSQQARRMAGL